MRRLLWGVLGSGLLASVASAAPLLQFDVNNFSTTVQNAANQASAFGGLNHTGRVVITRGSGSLAAMLVQAGQNQPFANAGFNNSLYTTTAFDGEIRLTNGQVTGGFITVRISNGDSYTTQIAANSGSVARFVGGGFTISALTNRGFFDTKADSKFGNVDVSPWLANQGTGGLPGWFIQFGFNPNANGFSAADMDWFVDAVPLPPAAWAGLATLAGVGVVRRLRRMKG